MRVETCGAWTRARRAARRARVSPPVLLGAALLAAFSLVACKSRKTDDADAGAPEAGAPEAGAPEAGAPRDAGPGLPGETAGCPEGMVRVRGLYCPDVEQKCAQYHEEYEKDEERKKRARAKGKKPAPSTVSERCLRFEKPSVCLSKERRPMDFCVDRYEYPNKKGEVPMLLVSWRDAKKTCEELGKRLCTEDEFNFACEGEEMLPYTYGFERDPSACNIDRKYRTRKRTLYKYARCMKNPKCAAELARLDQRSPAGAMGRCVSPFGAYDMNGNINEWVIRAGKHEYPDRSGLKGGWWGPVRNRCRPIVTFHKEEDYGYEEGFRCCKDASP